MKRGKENPLNRKGKEIMKTVNVVKMDKGYYITRQWYGRNMGSQWFKSQTAANSWIKEWTGANYNWKRK
jgi:hypothetical protein